MRLKPYFIPEPLTYEERKAQMLKDSPFETVQQETRAALETLEKHADPAVTVDDLYRALHQLHWPLGYPYQIVSGLIMYFWSSKIRQAARLFEQAKAAVQITKGVRESD